MKDPYDESGSVLDETVDEIMAGTKAVGNNA